MHTVVLDKEGAVWTFGCNDEGSLGRTVEEEEECFTPGKVELPEKIVQISAGDSHTAALTETGQVWLWGTFRDSSGPIGLVQWSQLEKTPVQVKQELERQHYNLDISTFHTNFTVPFGKSFFLWTKRTLTNIHLLGFTGPVRSRCPDYQDSVR